MKESINIEINGFDTKVIITRKNIKNMYLRVKEDMNIYITCNVLLSNKKVIKFIESNNKSITRMLEHQKRLNSKNDYFIYLGKRYEVVECNEFKDIMFDDNKVFVKSKNALDKFIRNEASVLFDERLRINYNKMNLDKRCPSLVIKKMKAKWGYYSKSKHLICLNLNLMSYSIDDIDYVIIHELCHIIHFNHSASFWNMVIKYKPNYKINRKNLKE